MTQIKLLSSMSKFIHSSLTSYIDRVATPVKCPLCREHWMSEWTEQVYDFRHSQSFICSVKLSKAKPPSGLISFSQSNHSALLIPIYLPSINLHKPTHTLTVTLKNHLIQTHSPSSLLINPLNTHTNTSRPAASVYLVYQSLLQPYKWKTQHIFTQEWTWRAGKMKNVRVVANLSKTGVWHWVFIYWVNSSASVML